MEVAGVPVTSGRDHVVSVRLPARDVALLHAQAADRGGTLSQAARRAIVAYLSGAATRTHEAPLQAALIGEGSLVVTTPRQGPTASTTGSSCDWWVPAPCPREVPA